MSARALVAAGLLVLATVVAYRGVDRLEFLEFDDDVYVTRNAVVRDGLSGGGLRWAFTTFSAANWHPLTWLSHMLDVELFGLDPRAHHRVNLALHAANALLLLALLQRLTGALWTPAFAAALFALHPLHVEPVAWVSERKELLALGCGLLSLHAWRAWAVHRSRAGYAAAWGLFALGLLAKPMLVSLPLLLFLLDVWPLRRWPSGARNGRALLVEKLPFLLLAAASSAVTWWAQATGGGVWAGPPLPLSARLANAVVAYARYLGKSAWPTDLIALYPHPLAWPAATVAGAGVLLVGLSALALLQRERRPWLLVGWAWFAIALVPVIGLVQVGRQSLADRYTYLPHVGLFVAVAWSFADLAGTSRARRAAASVVALGLLAGCLVVTRAQVPHWRNTVTLWGHALAVDPQSPFAHVQYGAGLAVRGETEAPLAHFREALRLEPGFARAHFNLARARQGRGELAAAVQHYEQALAARPEWSEALWGLGMTLLQSGDDERARSPLERASRLEPDAWQPPYGLGLLAERAGSRAEAQRLYRRALERSPGEPLPLQRLAWLLATAADAEGRDAAAALDLVQQLCRRTGCRRVDELEVIAAVQAEAGRFDEALRTVETARAAARAAGRPDAERALQAQAERYRQGRPLRVEGAR